MGKLFERFGKSRREIWRKLSAELGGRYSEGTWRKADRIDIEHGPWTITLDVYHVMAGKTLLLFTRFRAPFRNKEQFRMRIYRSSIPSTIGKWFGMQDIEVGALQFDADFIVKSNDERLVREFCHDAALRGQIMAQKAIDVSVTDNEGWFGTKYPEDVDLLNVVVNGHLEDAERIGQLFDLFAAALDRLCAIGAAYEDEPGHDV